MAYNNNIPQPTDRRTTSQKDMLENFMQLYDVFNINHASFNSQSPPAGTHTQVDLPEQGAAPATAVNEAALFSQQGAITGNTELAWRRENNGAVINFTEFLNASSGYTRMPSGLLIKWQRNTIPVAGIGISTRTDTFNWTVSANIPVFNTFIIGFVTTTNLSDVGVDTRINSTTGTISYSIFTISTNTLGGWNPFDITIIGLGT